MGGSLPVLRRERGSEAGRRHGGRHHRAALREELAELRGFCKEGSVRTVVVLEEQPSGCVPGGRRLRSCDWVGQHELRQPGKRMDGGRISCGRRPALRRQPHLTASPTTIPFGGQTTLTATVTNSTFSSPTGTVQFYVGGVAGRLLGTATLVVGKAPTSTATLGVVGSALIQGQMTWSQCSQATVPMTRLLLRPVSGSPLA